MKFNIQTAAALAFTAALSGCVTMEQKPVAFDDGHSLAYNIARAGGLETGIKDATAPKNSNTGMPESSMYNTASAAVAYANPTTGLSNAQGLGLNLIASAIAPNSHGARSSIVAWMPASQAASAEEAQSKMIDIVSQSLNESLNKQNLKFSKTRKSEKGTSFFIEDSKLNCESIDQGSAKACVIYLNIFKPIKISTPEFVKNGDKESWAFTSSHGFYYNAMKMEISRTSSINTLDVVQDTSVTLPNWVYIYSSPNDTYIDRSKKKNSMYPMILSKGNAYYFVK